MFFFFKYHVKIFSLFLIFILSACNFQDPNNTHGIIFLENRSNKLVINSTNKNDVIKVIGQPQIKDNLDNELWIYVERDLSKGKYHQLGKHKLVKNNVLVLKFNKYGILKEKTILNKEDINKINFSKDITINDVTKKSFVQSFLESIKQKMYGNK